MLIFPAIDLYQGKAVRLFQGDYDKMTVYHEDPLCVARDFQEKGATCIHMVDLEGAKTGNVLNLETVKKVAENTDLFLEIGGGIRNLETVSKYLDAGADRVILGTAAVKDEAFLLEAIKTYGDKIAVGIDVKDGKVAIRGWTELSDIDAFEFFEKMERVGVKHVICTDITKDGAMQGPGMKMYQKLLKTTSLNLIASGGVSTLDDVKKLADLGLHGAIIGKAYYTGAIDLREAIEAAK